MGFSESAILVRNMDRLFKLEGPCSSAKVWIQQFADNDARQYFKAMHFRMGFNL